MNSPLLNRSIASVFPVFLKHYIFWVLIFFIQRMVFVIYYSALFNSAGFSTLLLSFYYGLRLDLSMAGYFAVLPFLLCIIQLFFRYSFFTRYVAIYTWILLLLTTLMSGGDLGIYENWGVKLNYRAISMLARPGEALESVKSSPVAILVVIMLFELIISWFLYRVLIAKETVPVIKNFNRKQKGSIALVMLAIAFCIGLSIRGGWQEIPINESTAYFCSLPVANHAAVNTAWHLSNSYLKNRRGGQKNVYTYLPVNKAAELVSQLYDKENDSVTYVLKERKPNIVFIQLESFTADVIEELGGDSGVAPNLSKMIREGILFTNLYASGVRTDQGIIALLSGFPAQPQTSIVDQPDKIEHLPFLSLSLKNAGYDNSFYYGGDLGFGRFNTLAFHAGFSRIVGLKDFANAGMFNKWGADDKSLLDKYVAEMQKPKQPFFSYIITSSSHEPFTVPMQAKFTGQEKGEKFKNACYFTDKSLGEFIQAAKQMEWFKSTLFILVADHGQYLPRERLYNEPGKYHIPLIFFGEVLKDDYRGKKFSTLGSQTDIAGSLLRQLQLDNAAFKWSVDLFSADRKEFAFYTFDDGFGWVSPTDTISFDNRAKRILTEGTRLVSNNDSVLTTGKAYMQMLYEAYLKY